MPPGGEKELSKTDSEENPSQKDKQNDNSAKSIDKNSVLNALSTLRGNELFRQQNFDPYMDVMEFLLKLQFVYIVNLLLKSALCEKRS